MIRFSKETDALVHFVSVLASLYFPSVFSMIFSVLGAFRPAFPVPRFFGVAKVETYFLFSKSFLKIFSVPCPAPSGNPFRDTPSFQTGLQRYSFFPSFQTFMQLFFAFRTGELRPNPSVYHFKLHGVRKLRN